MTNEIETITRNNRTHNVNEIVDALNAIDAHTFTIANLSRAMQLNEKTSRRKLRAQLSKSKNERMSIAKYVRKTKNNNVKHEFDLTRENVVMMMHIIA